MAILADLVAFLASEEFLHLLLFLPLLGPLKKQNNSISGMDSITATNIYGLKPPPKFNTIMNEIQLLLHISALSTAHICIHTFTC
jgi:hypothetical protein